MRLRTIAAPAAEARSLHTGIADVMNAFHGLVHGRSKDKALTTRFKDAHCLGSHRGHKLQRVPCLSSLA